MKITLAQLKKAYDSCSYSPVGEIWIDPYDKQCCPLSAIAMSEGCSEKESAIISYVKSKYGDDFVEGFIGGFDEVHDYPSEQELGYKNGKKMRKILSGVKS